jgi:oxygen-dependent protoporphyrinogen oxidase
MSETTTVCIVGGGVSGLTAAFWLRQAGIDTIVLEKEPWPGGTMRTTHENGWLIETGPNSALETTPLLATMFTALGLEEEREYANPASDRRYVLRDGTLHPIPMSPGAFLTSRLWTTRAKLRLLREPFVGRAAGEESIAEFVARRLGREFLDYAINPFVAGVYAGNPEELSVRSAFPKLYALEEKYGGLIKGMIRGAKERRQRAEKAKDRARMFSFKSGMQAFPDALARDLGWRVRCGAEVRRVERTIPGGPGGPYRVVYREKGASYELQADAVVLSVPSYVAGPLLRPYSETLATQLGAVYYPPVAEVFLGFRLTDLRRPLDGFGYLIPAVERRNILGTIWSSALFSGRAPAGHAALTTFVGGSRQPHLVDASERELVDLVLSDLRSIMGVSGDPVIARVIRWDRAIPQYRLGYGTFLAEIERFEAGNPGLFVCSNYRGGIAVGDCVMNAEKTATRVRAAVRQFSPRSEPS